MKLPSLKAKLIAEYIENEISMTQLAIQYGISRDTIRVWLKERGLKNKYHKQSDLNKKEIIRLYVIERKSTEEIASFFKVSVQPIRSILHKAKVNRTQPETMRGKWIGEKNPNWKGGISRYDKWREKVQHYSSKMLIFSNSVKLRDKYTCRMCGSLKNVESNHIIPVRDIVKERELFDINNGITLCRKCHLSIHMKEHEYIEYFRLLILSGSV